jgi:3-deoxy-D-manno-octulosonic-acid transferase
VKEQAAARAVKLFNGRIPCFFAPLDILGPTRRAFECFRPDVLVCLETEIWPNLIVGARRAGVRTAIVNGRISVRTVRSYRRLKSLMRYTLSRVDAFSMISMSDADRLASMGALHSKITVNGNAKFDGLDPMDDGGTRKGVMSLLGIDEQTPVLVAGSTRSGEEPILLTAFSAIRKRVPQSVMIIAPRHVERARQILRWVEQQGLEGQLRSQIDGDHKQRCAPVVILDTMGELGDIYSVAHCVFCGGSLVFKGGQNILEPAMWGKPTLYGPSMEDFSDAVDIVQRSGGGVQVTGADDLTAAIIRWFEAPDQALAAGRAARRAILSHTGAAEKHAAVIANLLP